MIKVIGLFKQRTVICRKCGHVISKDRAIKKVSNQFISSYADVTVYFCEEHAPGWDREEMGFGVPRYFKTVPWNGGG